MSEIQEIQQDQNEPQNTNESFLQKIFKMLKSNSILIISLLVAIVAFFYIKNNDSSQVLSDSFSPEMGE